MTPTPPLLQQQRDFFSSGATQDLSFRLTALQRLKQIIAANEAELCRALAADLGKPELEAVIAETAFLMREIDHLSRNLHRWAKPQRRRASLLNFPARGELFYEPYGVALIIAPWNYPLQLLLSPLAGALAAGNCAVLKPSELAPHTAAVVSRMLAEAFPAEQVSVVQGGPEVAQELLEQPFDVIFFTGSARVGRLVMQAAARHLTPVTLELGGKSPAIVDRDADLAVAARRIVWGKFFNAGQTCVAPDFLLVHAAVKEELLAQMRAQVTTFYGNNPAHSPDFARIIDAAHLDRLQGYLGDGTIVCGGQFDREQRYLAPTILDQVSWQAPIMQEEIFGPILPVLSFTDQDDPVQMTAHLDPPLACYYFSRDPRKQRRFLERKSFGGGCINDTLMHLSEHHLPFGGISTSGLGRYHGRASFEAFSHQKSILHRGTWLDLPLRYPPYSGKLKWLKALLRWL